MPRLFRAALTITVFATLAAGIARFHYAAESKDEFASTTIDLGVVVSNLDAAVKFYTEAIGFKEIPGLSVPVEVGTDLGLTDHHPLKIRMLVLGDGPSATKLKVMELPGVSSRKSDNGFIHSQLGYRYITIFVTDGAAAAERLAKAGVKPLAKAPVTVALPNLPRSIEVSVVRDPDGNLVELIAPHK